MSTHVIHESRVLTVMTRLWQWGIASWIFLIHLYVTPIVCGFSSMTSYKFEPEPLQRHYRRLHFKLPLILMFCFFVLNEHQVVKWGGGVLRIIANCFARTTQMMKMMTMRTIRGWVCVKPAWWKVSKGWCSPMGLPVFWFAQGELAMRGVDWFFSRLVWRPFTREELKTKANKNYNKKQKKPRRWITWPITWVGCEFRGGWFRANGGSKWCI